MVDEESEGLNGEGSEGTALQEHIAHWVDVLDHWVTRIDSGLGRQVVRAGPAGADGGGDNSLRQMDEVGDLAKGVQG